jgi:hypothetical protein
LKKIYLAMRILDFNKFSALFEAEELQGQTEDTLKRIVNHFFICYSSLSALTDGYTRIMQDLSDIQNAEGAAKLEKMRDAAKSVADDVNDSYKAKNVNVEWQKAADKFTEALEALVNQYSGDEEIIKAMDDRTNTMIDEYKEELVKAKKDADEATKDAKAAVKESIEYGGESIFEAWTKKGNVRSLNSQAVALKAQLEGQKDSQGMQALVGNLLKEVSDIIMELAELGASKRKDIDNTRLQEIGNRMNEIPVEIAKQEEKMAKANTANKEASVIFIQGLDLVENALKLEKEVEKEIAKQAEEAAIKKDEEERAAKKIELSGDLDPDRISGRRKNSEVAKFQQAVIDKFKDYEPFDDFALFQKFMKYGADGMFGSTTKAIVKALKAGFEMDDTSDVITQELMDKIVYEPLNESEFKFLRDFSSFDTINEAFNPDKAKGSSPAPKAPRPAPEEEADEEAAEEAPQIDVDKIVEEIQDLLSKANNRIVDLYDDTDYWKEYKGTFNDDEDEAVADVYGKRYDSRGTWWYRRIRVPFVKKAADLLNDEYKNLKLSDRDAWEHLWDEIREFGETYKQLRKKTVGSSYNDSYKWSLKLYNGNKESYEVDCDF